MQLTAFYTDTYFIIFFKALKQTSRSYNLLPKLPEFSTDEDLKRYPLLELFKFAINLSDPRHVIRNPLQPLLVD